MQKKLLPFIFYSSLIAPFIYNIWPIITDEVLANPLETLTIRFGRTALYVLLATLWVSPLRKIFKNLYFLKYLNKNKKSMGLVAYFYATLHMSLYFVDVEDLSAIIKDIQAPFYIASWGAYIVLVVLSFTSINAVRKRLKKRFKAVHQFVYLALLLVLVHVLLKEKRDDFFILVSFVPIIIAELTRYYLHIKNKGFLAYKF